VSEEFGAEKSSKKEKIKKKISDRKAKWRTPNEKGEYLSYREILSYSFGSSGVNGLGTIATLTSLNSSTILIGSVYQMSPFIIYIMTSVITFISLVKTPIISTIMDNTGGRR
jgi:hypothetical protein